MRRAIRAGFSRAAHIIAASADVARAVQAYAGIPGARIATIPNTIDPARVHGRGNRVALRQRLALPGERPLLVSVGRFMPQKGYLHLLHALAILAPEERPLTLFVGDGPDRADLETQARVLGLAADTRFLGQRQDVPAILAAADIFVLS